MEYVIKYKKKFFWKKMTIKGHNLDKDLDRMDLHTTNGGVLSIPKWSKYTFQLGSDWVMVMKDLAQKAKDGK